MFNVFSTALSALSAMSTAIDVTGNNLANMDTTGFKGSDMAFSDLISQSIGNNGGTEVGFGTAQPLTIQDFSQGAIQSETSPLDAAIQGSGFFIAQDANGNTTYTRDGTFQVDNSGNLTTQSGQDVQGWTALNANGSINTSGPIGNIALTSGALLPPVATTQMTVSLNLNAASAADATSSFSTPVTVYDSLGTAHVLTVDFQNAGGNTWSYQVTVPGADVTAGTAGTPFDIPNASGTLTFNSSGQLTGPATGAPIAVAIPGLADGAADMNVSWNPYSSAGAG
jgi:flagellar hook protein FlgE